MCKHHSYLGIIAMLIGLTVLTLMHHYGTTAHTLVVQSYYLVIIVIAMWSWHFILPAAIYLSLMHMVIDGIHLNRFSQSAFLESLLLLIISSVFYGLILTKNNLSKSAESILEATETGTLHWHLSKDKISISPSWATLIGYEKKSLIPLSKKRLYAFIHPDDLSLFQEAIDTNLHTLETTFDINLRMQHNKGHFVWVQVKGKVIKFSRTSKPLSLSATFTDITHFKFVQHELKHMSQLMRYIIDHGNSAIAVHDIHMRYVFVSQNYLKQFDVTEKDIIGKHHYDVFPDLPQKWRDVHQRVLKGEVISNDKDLYISQNGKEYWTRWECRPWYLSDGSIGGLIVYTEVINEILDAEKERESHQQRLQLIMDHLPIGIAVNTVEPQVKFVYMNDNFASIYGVSKSELMQEGTFWERVYEDPTYRKYLENRIIKDIQSGDPSKMMWRNIPIVRGNLPTRYISAYATPLKEDNLLVSTVIDVTDQNLFKEEVDHLIKYDTLTHLYRRDYFSELFVTLNTKMNYPLGLVLLDINGLKVINDAFGFDQGNYVIKKLSEIIQKHAPNKAILGRLGGDEFAMAVPKTTSTSLDNIIKKIINEANTIKVEGTPISVTAGSAMQESDHANHLLKRAEDELLKRKIIENRSAKNNAIKAILNTLTAKYAEEKVHSERVSRFCRIIAERLELKTNDVDAVALAGLYHDIGKIAIPDVILDKPSSLDDREYEIIKTHTKIGYDILKAADEYSSLAEDALHHHERFDGKGYPSGLKGNEISLFSRIICVADAYEAMTSDRPYRKALPQIKAIEELKRHSGTQFDPLIVTTFVNYLNT